MEHNENPLLFVQPADLLFSKQQLTILLESPFPLLLLPPFHGFTIQLWNLILEFNLTMVFIPPRHHPCLCRNSLLLLDSGRQGEGHAGDMASNPSYMGS